MRRGFRCRSFPGRSFRPVRYTPKLARGANHGGWASSMSKLSILGEIWAFMRVRKKWWLLPIILFMVVFGALLVLTQNTALAPFIYALF